MTALTGPRDNPQLDDEAVPDVLSYPIAANTVCHQGGMVCLDTNGRCVPAGAGAAVTSPIGVAVDEVDNTTANAANTGNSGLAGCVNVQVKRGAFKFVSATGNDSLGVAQSITNSSISAPCYIVDDQTVALTDNGGLRKFAGWILGVDVAGSNGGPNFPDGTADGLVQVQCGSDFVHPGVNPSNPVGMLSMSIPLTGLVVGGGTAATFTPGFAGRILRASYSTTLAGTGAGATFAMTIKIGGSAITGGTATLTLANQTQGAELAASSITGANSFTAAQAITIVNAAGTVFTAGQVNVNLWLG